MPVAVLTDGAEIPCENFEESEGGIYLRDEEHDLVAFVPYGQLRFVVADDADWDWRESGA